MKVKNVLHTKGVFLFENLYDITEQMYVSFNCHFVCHLALVYLIAKNGLISSVCEIKNTFLHTPQYSSPFAIWGANASSFPTSSLIFSNATSSCATSITSKGSFCASSTVRIRCWRFLIWVERNELAENTLIYTLCLNSPNHFTVCSFSNNGNLISLT